MAALAADEPPKDFHCAFASTIERLDRWGVIDDRTIIIEPTPKRQFKITFTTSCPDLKFANFLRIRGNGTCLGPGDRVFMSRTFNPSGNPNSVVSCLIKKVERVGALPKNERN